MRRRTSTTAGAWCTPSLISHNSQSLVKIKNKDPCRMMVMMMLVLPLPAPLLFLPLPDKEQQGTGPPTTMLCLENIKNGICSHLLTSLHSFCSSKRWLLLLDMPSSSTISITAVCYGVRSGWYWLLRVMLVCSSISSSSTTPLLLYY
jgi:hypothetical protein